MTKRRRALHRDARVAIVVLAASVALLVHLLAAPTEGVSRYVGPSTLPTVLAGAIALLSGLMLLGSVRDDARVDDRAPLFGAPTLVLVGVLVVYLVALPWIGFLPATCAFVASLARLFGERRPGVTAALAIAVSLALYLFFEKFMIIPLPDSRLLG